MRFQAILGLATALVGACSGGSATSAFPGSAPPVVSGTPSPQDVPSAVRPSVSAAASRVADILVGGDRPVTIHVPAGYEPDRPAPLLIVLHGYGSSGQEHDTYFHLGQLAEQRGFLYAYPDGTFDTTGSRFWNATDACCDFDRSGVDDGAYLADVIAETRTSLAVDPKRVYLVGHSNGGFMSYGMACAHADLIAAMVSLAGATFARSANCAPAVPLAVLQIHGTADDTVLFTGGTLEGLGSGRPMAAYPGAKTSVSTWAKYNGCATSSVVAERVDVDADLGSADSPAEATVSRWTGCRPGGAVELWTIPGGGHGPNLSESFPKAVLDYLESHPKP